ncbi:MAG: 3-isopropylmalate dehydrogenase, partial [Burkholderiaceae bacterium]
MHTDHDIKKQALADAWATLHAHANNGEALRKDSYRFAFADPEFLMRNETRGVRLQLEMAKPDLIQQALGIDHTIVVFGSARFKDQAT